MLVEELLRDVADVDDIVNLDIYGLLLAGIL